MQKRAKKYMNVKFVVVAVAALNLFLILGSFEAL